jgi:hypothetical protein
MRVSSRSTILLLASTFALAPVLAVADKTPPKAGPKASTKEALHRKVGTVKIRDWKVQVEGTPVPDGNVMAVKFRVSNSGTTGLPYTTLRYRCQIGGTPQTPWTDRPCPIAGAQVPFLPAGRHRIFEAKAYKPFSYFGHPPRCIRRSRRSWTPSTTSWSPWRTTIARSGAQNSGSSRAPDVGDDSTPPDSLPSPSPRPPNRSAWG